MLVRRPELAMVLASAVLLGLASSFVLPFLSVFGTEAVGMTLLEFSGFTTATTVASVLVATWLSGRSDRSASRRSTLLLGAGAGALGYAGYAVTRDVVPLLVIGCGVVSISSVTFPQLFAHARDRLEHADLPRADIPLHMNTLRMFISLAWTTGPALAALLVGRHGFTGLFFGASALCALLFGVLWWCLPVDTKTPAPTPDPARKTSFWASVSHPGVLRWFAGLALLFACQALSMLTLPLLVLGDLGGTLTHVSIVFGLAPVFELPLMLYVGVLATRVGHDRLIRWAACCLLVYYAAITSTAAPWHVYPLQLLVAAAISVTNGVAITFFQDRIEGHRGAATNLFSTAQRIGSVSGYLLFGIAGTALGYRGIYAMCVALVAAALVLMRDTSTSRSDREG